MKKKLPFLFLPITMCLCLLVSVLDEEWPRPTDVSEEQNGNPINIDLKM